MTSDELLYDKCSLEVTHADSEFLKQKPKRLNLLEKNMITNLLQFSFLTF